MHAARVLPSRGFALLGLLIVLVIILIMFSMYSFAPSGGSGGGGQNAGSGLFGSAPQGNAPTIAKSTSDAIYAARQAVKNVIAEPQLAEFPLPDDARWQVKEQGGGGFEVVGQYDIRDRAGLPVPHPFTVHLAPDANKKLRPSYIEVDGVTLLGP